MSELIKLTPEMVIAKYKATGIRPASSMMNLAYGVKNEIIKPANAIGCCALGVMMVGLHRDEDGDARPESYFDINFWDFVDGFDRIASYHIASYRSDHQDYILGESCRKAVEAEFGPIG